MASKLTEYLAENPLYATGGRTAQEGTSTAPVYSVWQGLARALQGGLGGYMQGRAISDAKENQTSDNKALAEAMAVYGTDPNGAMAKIANRPMLSDVGQALMVSRAGKLQELEMAKAKGAIAADSMDATFRGGAPAGGAVAGAPAAGGSASDPAGYANNIGNVRPVGATSGFNAYATPQEGVAGAIQNVRAYPGAFNGGKPMTLQQIGQHWAREATDPPAVGDAWAAGVAKAGGLPADQPLDFSNPQTALAFARGVHTQEKGGGAAFHPDVYAQGVQLAQAGPVKPSGVHGGGGGGVPASGGEPHAGDADAQRLWATLKPMVMSGQMPAEKAREMIQSDAQSRRQIYATERGLNERENFRAEQARGQHTLAVKSALEGDETFKAANRAKPLLNSVYAHAAAGDPVSNVALVRSVASIVSPQAVDREGRVELSRAGTAFGELKEAMEKALQNGTLTAEKRAELVAIAERHYEQLATEAHKRGLDHRSMAKSLGLNPDHIYNENSFRLTAPPVVVRNPGPRPDTVPPPPGPAPLQAGPGSLHMPGAQPPPAAAPPITFGRDAQGRLIPAR